MVEVDGAAVTVMCAAAMLVNLAPASSASATQSTLTTVASGPLIGPTVSASNRNAPTLTPRHGSLPGAELHDLRRVAPSQRPS
jgi:hypothetical protein